MLLFYQYRRNKRWANFLTRGPHRYLKTIRGLASIGWLECYFELHVYFPDKARNSEAVTTHLTKWAILWLKLKNPSRARDGNPAPKSISHGDRLCRKRNLLTSRLCMCMPYMAVLALTSLAPGWIEPPVFNAECTSEKPNHCATPVPSTPHLRTT